MTVCIESPGASILQGPGKEVDGIITARPFNLTQYLLVSKLLDETEPTTIEVLSGLVKVTALQDTIVTIVGEATARINGQKSPINMVFILFRGKTLQVMPNSSAPIYIGFSKLKLSRNKIAEIRNSTMKPILPGEIFDCEPINRSRVHIVGRFLKETPTKPVTSLRYIPEIHFPEAIMLCSPWKPIKANRYMVTFEGQNKISIPPILTKVPTKYQHGSIHISPEGKPFISGPEVGKAAKVYTMVGKIIEVDLSHLSNLNEIESLTFSPVTEEAAEDFLAKHHIQMSTIVVDPLHVGSW